MSELAVESISGVQARMSQLQALLSGVGDVVPGAGSGSASGSASGSPSSAPPGTAFATTLAGLLGGAPATGSTGLATGSARSEDLGGSAVTIARNYLGVPYVWGGNDPSTGLDCSGLTKLVYSQLGVTLPRVAADQAGVGTEVATLAQARPGDLVFFGQPAHHVGIYVGGGQMIDAPHAGASVGVHAVWGTPSQIRRVLPAPNLDLEAASGIGSGLTSGIGAKALSGPYADLFTAAGARYGVDPALLSAVAKAESGYDPNAGSGAGAQGLMQLMPATARSLGVDALNPAQAVDGGARLLAQLLNTYHGQVDLALAGYNAGPGAVQRYGGIPPYPETRTYVSRVTSYWEALR